MNRSVLIFLLGLLILGGLVTFELVSLGILGGDDEATSPDELDLRGADGVEGGEAATLKGRAGTKAAEGADAGRAVDPADDLPAEVHGSTKNGGSVRGRVVRGDGGVPMPGVRVTLGRPDSLITYLRAKANGRFDTLEARTGADGRFAFLDVTPSKGYVVRARHPEHAVCSHPDTIDLTGRDAVDVGDLALGAGGTLVGRVVGPDGTPLPNVRVVAAWRISNPIGIILADPATAPELERETKTDKEGRWKLARLDPTPKTIFAVAPTGASQVVRSVVVQEGERTEVDDIRLPGAGAIAGTVVWADGTPVPGARVFAAPQMQAAVRTDETDEKGSFRLAWLPEGEEYVIGTLIDGLPVNLTMGASLGDEDVRIEFPMPGALDGVVVAADGGAPVPAFAVQLDPANPSDNWQLQFVMDQVKRGLGPTPFEDPEGRFALPRVATGTYHLTVSAPGYPPVVTKDVEILAGETAAVRVELPRGHGAKGIVRRADGTPLGGARIHVVDRVPSGVGGPGLARFIGGRDPAAVADATGRFAVPPQTPGRYALIASHPEALAGVLRDVDLATGDANDLEVRMPPCASIRGRLLDEHARPAKEQTIYVVYRDGVARTAGTDEDGRFSLAGLPLGRCVVRWLSLRDMALYGRVMRERSSEEARHAAFEELALSAGEQDLRDGSAIELSLSIPRRVEVRGRYTLAGEPLAKGKQFYVTIPGGGHWVGVTVGDGGAYTHRLLPGTYIVYGPGASDNWTSQRITIEDGPSQTLDIDMP